MSTSVATTIRMEKDLKQQFEETCAGMGLNFTTAINIFAKRVVREQCIPFTLTNEIPNAETRSVLDNVEKGINLSRPFDSVEELMEDLYADD